MHIAGKLCLLSIVLWIAGCFAIIEQPQGQTYQSSRGWVINGSKAKALHQKGALFLDCRSKSLYSKLHIQGAIHTTWQRFSETKAPYRGRLLAQDSTLTQRLQELGVSQNQEVVVYGSPASGWGEEGRILWMLRVLGHSKVYLVDGGYLALAQAGLPTTQAQKPSPKGDFVVRRSATWSISRTALQKQIAQKRVPAQLTLIDTRELREFRGETPYGESRGGHIPGSVHLHFQSILNTLGFLKPKTEILKILQKRSINSGKPIVVYCTGGIRSGWLAIILLDLGFKDVKNYAGSMWEWSSGSPQTYPLAQSK